MKVGPALQILERKQHHHHSYIVSLANEYTAGKVTSTGENVKASRPHRTAVNKHDQIHMIVFSRNAHEESRTETTFCVVWSTDVFAGSTIIGVTG